VLSDRLLTGRRIEARIERYVSDHWDNNIYAPAAWKWRHDDSRNLSSDVVAT